MHFHKNVYIFVLSTTVNTTKSPLKSQFKVKIMSAISTQYLKKYNGLTAAFPVKMQDPLRFQLSSVLMGHLRHD